MGTYNISTEEIYGEFKELLQNQEGDVSAHTIAEAWNKMADESQWNDKLKVVFKDGKDPEKELKLQEPKRKEK